MPPAVLPERSADRRQEILDTAAGLFCDQGYRATRLDDIAAQMGFTRQALYRHSLAYLSEPQIYTVFRLEVGELPNDLRAALMAGEHAYVHTISRIVGEAMHAGLLTRRPVLPATLAILSMANSTATWFRSDGLLTAEEAADLIVELALDGLRTRPEAGTRRPQPRVSRQPT